MEHGRVTYIPWQIEEPNEHTQGRTPVDIDAIESPTLSREARMLRHWLDAWTALSAFQREVIELWMREPHITQRGMAERLGVSKQAVNQRVRRVRKRFPGLMGGRR